MLARTWTCLKCVCTSSALFPTSVNANRWFIGRSMPSLRRLSTITMPMLPLSCSFTSGDLGLASSHGEKRIVELIYLYDSEL